MCAALETSTATHVWQQQAVLITPPTRDPKTGNAQVQNTLCTDKLPLHTQLLPPTKTRPYAAATARTRKAHEQAHFLATA